MSNVYDLIYAYIDADAERRDIGEGYADIEDYADVFESLMIAFENADEYTDTDEYTDAA